MFVVQTNQLGSVRSHYWPYSTATARVQGITATDEGQCLFVLSTIPCPQPRLDKDTSNFYTLISNADSCTALK